jgi:enoyl-[acyl-carrier protein] reductase I
VSFLNLRGKNFLIVGVANRKSVAWAIAKILESEGANLLYCVRSEKRRLELQKFIPSPSPIFICDFENPADLENLQISLESERELQLNGVVHSIAFANYTDGVKPFHETKRNDFLQATQISSFSLVELARICKPFLVKDASFITIGISSTAVTAENYGYMAPIKASLEASIRYLAKSFSKDTSVRFNSVNAGPLKTSASAGIPGYLVNYLYAEKMTFRKKALQTEEVANLAAFLLSPRSSGINGQGIVIDAGMGMNYFDQEIVQEAMRLNP